MPRPSLPPAAGTLPDGATGAAGRVGGSKTAAEADEQVPRPALQPTSLSGGAAVALVEAEVPLHTSLRMYTSLQRLYLHQHPYPPVLHRSGASAHLDSDP